MKQGPRLFGHPVHPMLTHLPVGLLTTVPGWELAGLATNHAAWWSTGFRVLVVGVVAAVPAAVSGAMDFAALPTGHRAAGLATRHMTVMIAAVSAFAIDLAVRGGAAAPVGVARWLAPGCSAVGLALLAWGGWCGGELVHREGLGRR